MTAPGYPFIVSGPSGVGKNTVLQAAVARDPQLVYSTSTTTRPPREGEREGDPYFFVSLAEFQQGIAAGRFAEYAEVYGHYYGTDRHMLDHTMASGRDVITDVDTVGAEQLARVYPQSVRIYLMPPSIDELERRLRARKRDADAEMQRRLAEFAAERARIEAYTHVLVNDNVETAAADLLTIVRAHRLRRERMRLQLEAQGWTFTAGSAS